MKKIYCLIFFFLLTINYSNASSFSNCKIEESFFSRSIEIRYIERSKVSATSKTITVDGIEYKIYESKKEAIQDVLSQKFKKDITIVYVKSELPKSMEIAELND